MIDYSHTVNVHHVGLMNPITGDFFTQFLDIMADLCSDEWCYDYKTCTMYFKYPEDATAFSIRMVCSQQQREALHENFCKFKIVGPDFFGRCSSYLPTDRERLLPSVCEWLDENCEGPWCYDSNYLFFVSQRDAELFRMNWE